MMLELNKIHCVDCMEGMPNLPTVNGRKYCIVTDPPFNVGYHYNEYNDNKNEDEYYSWLSDIFQGYPCVVIQYPEALYKLSFQLGLFPERVISWVYNSNTPRQHRDIAYFGVTPDLNRVKQPYKNPNDKRIKARIAAGKTGAKMYDWMNINQVKNVSKKAVDGVIHPCQMPVEVMRRVVGVIPDEYIIVDPFIGSGSTAIACNILGRDWIGFENDPAYVKIAEKRIKEETP